MRTNNYSEVFILHKSVYFYKLEIFTWNVNSAEKAVDISTIIGLFKGGV